MTKASRDSTAKRRPSPRLPRAKSDLAGPLREVDYIFERKGLRGGEYWLLVLDCGHAVARKRNPVKVWNVFRPLSEKLAPKRVQCHYCGSGCEKHDPRTTIAMLGGPKPL